MNCNDLKYPIEVWKYNVSENEGGTPIEEFLLYKGTYAKMRVLSGSTTYESMGNLPFTNVEFTIRYDPYVNYRCQVKYNSVFYKINHIQPLDRKAWLVLNCVVYNEANY